MKLNIKQWLEAGEKRYGSNMLSWKFKCPSCGNIQSAEDFRIYKDQGASPDTARFNCIGRYDGHGDVPMCSGKTPCNYTSGGLFKLAPLTVIDELGKECSCFDFADSLEENKNDLTS